MTKIPVISYIMSWKVMTCIALEKRSTKIFILISYYENTPIQIYWKFHHK